MRPYTNDQLEDNEFECTRCGTSVYFEFTECPNCGLNFYYPDDDEDIDDLHDLPGKGFDISFGAILAGWVISGSVAFALHFLISRFYNSTNPNTFATILIFLIGPIGGIVGGFVTGEIVNHRSNVHGISVGILSIGVAIIMEAFWRDISTETLFKPKTVLNWGLIILSSWVGISFSITRQRRQIVEQLFSSIRSEDDLYDDLLAKVRFDRDTVERLIEYERKQKPGATRYALLQNAIDRWERDNR